jgi:hypothetical protein
MVIVFSSCKKADKAVFELIDSSHSGIHFSNKLASTFQFNAYTFRNFYNGGAVALGDINNDGLTDIYLTGNQTGNTLYLNKGDFKFEDVTSKSGLSCSNVWNTGTTMVDVNGDGWLDIFVCKSGPPSKGVRHNQMFLNNKDLTFSDVAPQWGIDDIGLSIQASFFDFDRDGDLDFYLSSNSNRPIGFFDLYEGQRQLRDSLGGNKLYRNEGDHFKDVSEMAGIYGSSIGYGLGVSVADINRDGWPDIFVANDFFEKDYLYMNKQNGSFQEVSDISLKSLSLGSMGADIGDLDNDGYPEIFVTDMLPSSLALVKSRIAFETFDKYSENVNKGFHHQFNRNMFQWNRGLIPGDTSTVFFSEIGRQLKMESSDWSWSALFFDYDNNGFKDIFITNGIAKELLDQDYITYFAPDVLNSKDAFKDSTLLTKLISGMPSHPTRNALFKNEGSLQFTNVSEQAGISQPSFSNGAAYGDLNNDGALDLVVNTIGQKALIYRNSTADKDKKNAFVQFYLTDQLSKNSFAIGAQITVFCNKSCYSAELFPVRGYLSSVDYKIQIGLGVEQKIDSVNILWPDGFRSRYRDIAINSLVNLDKTKGYTQKKVR